MSVANSEMARVSETAVPAKQSVLGVGISATSYAQVVEICRGWIEQARTHRDMPARYVCVTSVHGIVTAVKDPAFRSILNRADLATPDGMPVVWALRSFGLAGQNRVYGPDLMLALCQDAEERGHRLFLYGASEIALDALERNLKSRFPALSIAGRISPPFRSLTAGEDEAITREIRDSGADMVFVGLSTPKQEMWMAQHAGRLPGRILIGVGAAFDFHAGHLRQAPPWMRRRGLEWLFRLWMEPKRLWKRYVLETPVFIPLWALQKMGLRRFEIKQTPGTEESKIRGLTAVDPNN